MSEDTRTTTQSRRIPRSLLVVAWFAIAGLVLVGGLYLHYRSYLLSPLPKDSGGATFRVKSGASFADVLTQLEDKGLVTHPSYFRWYAKRSGMGSRIKAGIYTVPASTSPADVMLMLTRGGDDENVRFTLPEGYNIYQVADRVQELGLGTRREFLELVENPAFLEELGIEARSAEGYLFPDTYFHRAGAPLKSLVRRMVKRHQEMWQQVVVSLGEAEVKAHLQQYGMSFEDALTLASIVEKECVVDDERPVVARVFFNRMLKGMKLQTDPTCVYGASLYKKKPHPRYCKDQDNTYSTYVIEGLPPGPISNPGQASLHSVLRPSSQPGHEKLLFFVARADGSRRHKFSATYKEHRRAIKRK